MEVPMYPLASTMTVMILAMTKIAAEAVKAQRALHFLEGKSQRIRMLWQD
jgi:hypothetical protein